MRRPEAWVRVRSFSKAQREQYRAYVAAFEKALDAHLTEAQKHLILDCIRDEKPPTLSKLKVAA